MEAFEAELVPYIDKGVVEFVLSPSRSIGSKDVVSAEEDNYLFYFSNEEDNDAFAKKVEILLEETYGEDWLNQADSWRNITRRRIKNILYSW